MPLIGHVDFDALAMWSHGRAAEARSLLGIRDAFIVDAIDALDRLRDAGVIFGWKEVPDGKLPIAEAQWDPIAKTITVRSSVYESAKAGDPRARFTIAHEIGHAFMKHRFKRNRRVDGVGFGELLKTQEAEANRFAAAFLCPEGLAARIAPRTPRDLASAFGLSLTAAEIRLNELRAYWARPIVVVRPTDEPEEPDTYELYMRAVLRQAVAYPDK